MTEFLVAFVVSFLGSAALTAWALGLQKADDTDDDIDW